MIYDNQIYDLLPDVEGIRRAAALLTHHAVDMRGPTSGDEPDSAHRAAENLKDSQSLARDQLEILREYASALRKKCDAIIAEAENAGQLSIEEIKALANLPVDENKSFV